MTLGILPAVHVVPALTLILVSAGLLVLATLDIWRQEVEDYATVALLIIAVCTLLGEGISAQQWVSGVLSAALVFLIYLSLGMHGAMGGGDVKLSAVPALVLGAWAPLLGLWWVATSLVIQQGFALMASRSMPEGPGQSPRQTVALPHVPAMAAAFLAAAMVFPP